MSEGFGAKPQIHIVPLRGTEKEDFERCFQAYKRQGVSDRRALDLMAVSNVYARAEEAGLTPGLDVQYDPNVNNGEGGLYLSSAMAAVMKGDVNEKAWDYWEAEGIIATQPEFNVVEIDGEPTLSSRDSAKWALATVRTPEDTRDGGKSARKLCLWLLNAGGVPAAEAERKLSNWIKGDDTLLAELLSPMEAGFNEVCRQQQKEGNN
jgi:hypothetical protein